MLPLRDNVPGKTFPVVTVGLILVYFLVWFWELKQPGVDVHVIRDGFYPCTLHGPCRVPAPFVVHPLPWYEGVFTGMFMHASWEHILGNMLFFWIFGNNVEDALGHVGFLAWYLVAGIVAMAVQSVVTLAFAGAGAASVPNIGASGAIAGILGAYFVLLPRAKVLTVIFFGIILIREIPAVYGSSASGSDCSCGREGSPSRSRSREGARRSSRTSAASRSESRQGSSSSPPVGVPRYRRRPDGLGDLAPATLRIHAECHGHAVR
ncbi:MAG TPA: rhomboid family intramembrane serine protease [Gaiellaceae bacterium]|nr:rhomboid family intramembrane serine protease [Gaiellaceae bacterium]